MNRATRDRLVLPILLPVGALTLIAVLVIGFSRILLSLSKDAATVTALIAASGVLLTAVALSTLPKIRVSNLIAGIGAIAGIAMLAGGIALATVGGKSEGETGLSGPAPAVLAITAPSGAATSGYDQTKLTAPTGKPGLVEFQNQDNGVGHNVDVFSDDAYTQSIGKTAIVTGPAKATVKLPALKEGTLYFHCDVHPTTMTGTIEVGQAGAGGGTQATTTPSADGGTPTAKPSAGGPPSTTPSAGGSTTPSAGAVQLTAPSGASASGFEQKTLTLPTTGQVTLHFQNDDAGVMHNFGIYSADPATDPNASELFKGDPVTGPGSTDYSFAALPKGTYYFQCDFHPTTMNGSVSIG